MLVLVRIVILAFLPFPSYTYSLIDLKKKAKKKLWHTLLTQARHSFRRSSHISTNSQGNKNPTKRNPTIVLQFQLTLPMHQLGHLRKIRLVCGIHVLLS